MINDWEAMAIVNILDRGFRYWDGGTYEFMIDNTQAEFRKLLTVRDRINQMQYIMSWDVQDCDTMREIVERVSDEFAHYLVEKRKKSLAKLKTLATQHAATLESWSQEYTDPRYG